MKKIRNIRALLAVALSVLLASCNMEENTVDCLVNMRLTFRFTHDGQESFGPQEVPSVSVFVFDEADRFVGRWDEMDNTKFGTDYAMSLSLAPGAYSFVVWGGLNDTNYYLSTPGRGSDNVLTPVVGETAIDDFGVRILRNTRNSYTEPRNFVDAVPGALFYGGAGQRTLHANVDNEVTVDLMKLTQRINLTVIGMPAATARAGAFSHMDITLGSANGSYDFRGRLASDIAPLTYIQHDAQDDGNATQTSTLWTLRTLFENNHTLSIYNTSTGREFYSADILRDFIRKVPAYATQEEVDAEDEYDITIDVRSNLGVAVTVNGWNVGISGNIIQ